MHSSSLPTRFGVRLPEWVLAEVADAPATLASDEDGMRLVNRLAARNHREGTGGPFAALVVESGTGRLQAAGVNLVLASGLSSMHAEVVALSLAQVGQGDWDLGAADRPASELVVNWRPCVMCYGAAMWSGVRRLVIAGDGPEVEELTGFDEGPMRDDWMEQFGRRGIATTSDVLREEAVEVFRDYGRRTDAVVYNARGASRSTPDGEPE